MDFVTLPFLQEIRLNLSQRSLVCLYSDLHFDADFEYQLSAMRPLIATEVNTFKLISCRL